MTPEASAEPSSDVAVLGWPMPDLAGKTPSLDLGEDPVGGRQLCPALTRLNLADERSEELLLRRAVEEFRDEQRGALWRLEVRTGLFWWSGEPVQAGDVAKYVVEMLPELVAERGAGLWAVPTHEVKVEAPNDVVVRWKTAPVFGPFILNDAPFFRAAKGGDWPYECAGNYVPVAAPFGVSLKPASGYRRAKPLPEVHIYKEAGKAATASSAAGARTVALKYPSAVDGTLSERGKNGERCARTVELPYATMILWNTTTGPTADQAFRQLLTQLTPRGALVNEAAASLAQVASSPIPRQHPGFNGKVRTRPFDVKLASESLTRLGYKRKTASSPRLDPKGQPLSLTLRTQASSSGLVEKVVTDAFSAVGIAVKFEREPKGPVDGVLGTFELDWPRVSLLGNLHSRVKDTQPFWSPRDAALDKLLEDYAQTLTTGQPDFSRLAAIHARLAETEPMTVLLHHRACLTTGSDLRLAKGVDQTDPDWFRHLLF